MLLKHGFRRLVDARLDNCSSYGRHTFEPAVQGSHEEILRAAKAFCHIAQTREVNVGVGIFFPRRTACEVFSDR